MTVTGEAARDTGCPVGGIQGRWHDGRGAAPGNARGVRTVQRVQRTASCPLSEAQLDGLAELGGHWVCEIVMNCDPGIVFGR